MKKATVAQGGVLTKSKFKVGDLVKLVSGGPTMTVTAFSEAYISCHWFPTPHEPRAASFPPEALVNVSVLIPPAGLIDADLIKAMRESAKETRELLQRVHKKFKRA